MPLIAETGGINAMIVDSTALPEQVVADVRHLVLPLGRAALLGAAAAAAAGGDRRAALIEMLTGAMDTLVVGDPGDPATDVGPVIDQAAYDRLMALSREREGHAGSRRSTRPRTGLFVPPTLIRLDAIEDLTAEWFGPILHVATWQAGKLARDDRAGQRQGLSA